MKEHPILFSGPMVRAILDGHKAQTRRVVKPQPPDGSIVCGPELYTPAVERNGDIVDGPEVFGIYDEDGEWGVRCPYGVVGDRLWVRETWRQMEHRDGPYIDYRADGEHPHGWRPSIFMPREACRLVLEITAVRVERIQSMNWVDAIAEGIKDPRRCSLRIDEDRGPVAKFRELWDSLNAARGFGWSDNPWVWVITFVRILSDGRIPCGVDAHGPGHSVWTVRHA